MPIANITILSVIVIHILNVIVLYNYIEFKGINAAMQYIHMKNLLDSCNWFGRAHHSTFADGGTATWNVFM